MFKSCNNDKCEMLTDFLNNKLMPIFNIQDVKFKHTRSHTYDIVYNNEDIGYISWDNDIVLYDNSGESVCNGILPTNYSAKQVLDNIKIMVNDYDIFIENKMVLKYIISNWPNGPKHPFPIMMVEDGKAIVSIVVDGEAVHVSVCSGTVEIVYDSGEDTQIKLADPEMRNKVRELIVRKQPEMLKFRNKLMKTIKNSEPSVLWKNREKLQKIFGGL